MEDDEDFGGEPGLSDVGSGDVSYSGGGISVSADSSGGDFGGEAADSYSGSQPSMSSGGSVTQVTGGSSNGTNWIQNAQQIAQSGGSIANSVGKLTQPSTGTVVYGPTGYPVTYPTTTATGATSTASNIGTQISSTIQGAFSSIQPIIPYIIMGIGAFFLLKIFKK